MGGPAAERQQTRRRQIGQIDEDARAERERAEIAPGLALDHASDLERSRADEQIVAHAQVELREQLGTHQHAVVAQQIVRVRLSLQRHRSVERERRFHGAQFDHSSRGDTRGPHHRGQFDGFGHDADAPRRTLARDRRANRVTERPIASHHDVGAGHGPRFARQSLAHALNDRPNRHDRGDADRDAHEEEQQPLPGCPDLTQRHSHDERHRAASAPAAGTGRGLSSCPTGRPSRSTSRVSASAASSASWVTSTSVDERVRRTLSSRSMMCRPVVESRFPVGSSARTIGGSLASARAIAMRCCSPPDNCEG